jgi:DNA-binding MarR family transcriptional regulator
LGGHDPPNVSALACMRDESGVRRSRHRVGWRAYLKDVRDTPAIRLTTPTWMVLDVLIAAADDPPWGYRICEEAGLGSGTVYPILERLEEAGWIEGAWETGQPASRPRRRFYTLTSAGRAGYSAAIARRQNRTRAWLPRLHGDTA